MYFQRRCRLKLTHVNENEKSYKKINFEQQTKNVLLFSRYKTLSGVSVTEFGLSKSVRVNCDGTTGLDSYI